MISKLIGSRALRESYIRSKLGVLLPAQIRSLRSKRGMTQAELGTAAEMKQARISALERIGEGNFNLETLIRLAGALKVGLVVKFAPFSEMLEWENSFEPDNFYVPPIEQDSVFVAPENSRPEVSSVYVTNDWIKAAPLKTETSTIECPTTDFPIRTERIQPLHLAVQ